MKIPLSHVHLHAIVCPHHIYGTIVTDFVRNTQKHFQGSIALPTDDLCIRYSKQRRGVSLTPPTKRSRIRLKHGTEKGIDLTVRVAANAGSGI